MNDAINVICAKTSGMKYRNNTQALKHILLYVHNVSKQAQMRKRERARAKAKRGNSIH